MITGHRLPLRALAYKLVSWSGLVLIGIVAVPAAILIVIIFAIQEVMDSILKKIDP